MAVSQFDAGAFDRATAGLLQFFTEEQAQALVNYRGEPALQARITELADKNSAAALTIEERAEYEGYVRANKFIATLQAKVRQRLAGR